MNLIVSKNLLYTPPLFIPPFHTLSLSFSLPTLPGNPLWNQLLIAGFRGNAPFLGYVDLIGTAYEENFIATGTALERERKKERNVCT